jgi:hypothetical protein
VGNACIATRSCSLPRVPFDIHDLVRTRSTLAGMILETPPIAERAPARSRSRFRKAVLIGVLSVAGLVAGYHWAADFYYPVVHADVADPQFAVNQDPHAARGYGLDSARVDSQITLRIPTQDVDAVYGYLRDKYVGKSGLLQERFAGAAIRGQDTSDVSVFTDEYFDTPALDLYCWKNSARHRTRINTTDPNDRKSGRSLVQMKVTPPGKFTMRTELKYEVREPSKPSSKLTNPDNAHPLIGLIPKSQRDDFKQAFLDAGIDPYSLRHVFTISQTRKRGYINLGDKNILSFSVDEGSAGILWTSGGFASVDFGLVEIAYTEADAATRKLMWDIRDAMISDLKRRFPALVQNDDSKYSIVLDQLMRQLRVIPGLLRWQLL